MDRLPHRLDTMNSIANRAWTPNDDICHVETVIHLSTDDAASTIGSSQ